jgi:hypothetical protein
MTLWLPMIESARSYQSIFSTLKAQLPEEYACVNSRGLGAPQQDLLHYYANVKTIPLERSPALICDYYLIQDERGRAMVDPGHDWHLLWSGKRPSDRKESFRLYKIAQ